MSVVKPISLGQIVESVAGRDAHQIYLTVGISGKFIQVSNGRDKPVKEPKKKNIRHVRVYRQVSEFIANKLRSGEKVTDEEIRRVLGNLEAR